MTGDLGGGGLNWIVDVKYYVMPKLTVGAEYNSSAMIATGDGDLGIFGGNQFLAKAEYYFLDKKVSPYAGLGLGLSQVSTPEISVNSVVFPKVNRNNFGLSPRLGLKLGTFGLEFQYNIAGKTPLNTDLGQADKKFNFWTINLGYIYTFDMNEN